MKKDGEKKKMESFLSSLIAAQSVPESFHFSFSRAYLSAEREREKKLSDIAKQDHFRRAMPLLSDKQAKKGENFPTLLHFILCSYRINSERTDFGR